MSGPYSGDNSQRTAAGLRVQDTVSQSPAAGGAGLARGTPDTELSCLAGPLLPSAWPGLAFQITSLSPSQLHSHRPATVPKGNNSLHMHLGKVLSSAPQ